MRPIIGFLLPALAGSLRSQSQQSGLTADLGWNARRMQILWESDLGWDDESKFFLQV